MHKPPVRICIILYGKKLYCTVKKLYCTAKLYCVAKSYIVRQKSYIVRCFCLSLPGVACASSGLPQVETMVSLPLLLGSSCVKWNENITISGCWVIQYREYWTQKSCIGLGYASSNTAVSLSNIPCIGLLTIHICIIFMVPNIWYYLVCGYLVDFHYTCILSIKEQCCWLKW